MMESENKLPEAPNMAFLEIIMNKKRLEGTF